MNEERIKEVFSDEAFVAQIFEQETAEQVQELLAEKEIELSIKEIEKIKEYVEKALKGEENVEELSDEDLEDVSGGVIGLLIVNVIGLSVAVAAGGALVGFTAAVTDQVTRGRW